MGANDLTTLMILTTQDTSDNLRGMRTLCFANDLLLSRRTIAVIKGKSSPKIWEQIQGR